jgi:1-acyl-sn-glycerol-3-phosphate acyltransferase
MARQDLVLEQSRVLPALKRPKVRTASLSVLGLQRFIGWLLCIPFYETIAFILRFRGYRLLDHDGVRARYREVVRQARRDGTPLIVCANHLTFIDSCLMIWAFGSSFWYFRNFRAFTWNLPAGDFFKKKFAFRVVAYLGKCIFIHRDGSKEHKRTILDHCQTLVSRGEVLTFFPEGRRSRTGRFEADRLTFGAGKLAASLPGCRVLCVYLRGHKQETFSNYPRANSMFRLQMDLLQPTITQTGRDAYAEITRQIGARLTALEEEHFRWLPTAPSSPASLS